MVHVLLKPGLENFEHSFTSVWGECSCAVVWVFFGIAFLWDWNENWPFPVLWPLLSFPNFYDQPRQHVKKQKHHFANKGLSSQGYGFSSGHVWMWEWEAEKLMLLNCGVGEDSRVPWTAACQASLSFTISQSLLKLMSTESMISSNHLILCHPFLLLPSIFPSTRVFSNESALHIRWPMYWSFSFCISSSNEYRDLCWQSNVSAFQYAV